MPVLILATVTGHSVSPLADLAPDVIYGDRESSLEQQAPELVYGFTAAGRFVDPDGIGPLVGLTIRTYPSGRDKPARPCIRI